MAKCKAFPSHSLSICKSLSFTRSHTNTRKALKQTAIYTTRAVLLIFCIPTLMALWLIGWAMYTAGGKN